MAVCTTRVKPWVEDVEANWEPKRLGVIGEAAPIIRVIYRRFLGSIIPEARNHYCYRLRCAQHFGGACRNKCPDFLEKMDWDDFLELTLRRVDAHEIIWLSAAGEIARQSPTVRSLILANNAVNGNIAAWLLDMKPRIINHARRILLGGKDDHGPPVPYRDRQWIFPSLAIPDHDQSIMQDVEMYHDYWATQPDDVYDQLSVYPPTSDLERLVFRVKQPNYRLIFKGSGPGLRVLGPYKAPTTNNEGEDDKDEPTTSTQCTAV